MERKVGVLKGSRRFNRWRGYLMNTGCGERMELVPKVLLRTSASQVQRELDPVLRDSERDCEEQEVENLISVHDPVRTVLGID